MNTHSNKSKFTFLHLLCTALISVFSFLLIMAACNITPFGDETYLIYDMKRQYVCFYSYLKSVFTSNNNLLYTFSGSLGSDMTGLTAYNLMSPFLLIFLFVPVKYYPTAITIVYALKVAVMAVTMDALLLNLIGKGKADTASAEAPDNSFVSDTIVAGHFACMIMAVSYSLCIYVITYGTNFMWLDGMILLPLVILSIEKLYHCTTDKERAKSGLFYSIPVAVTMITNYYIGYMIMIFIILWFVLLFISDRKRNVKILKTFSLYSLLGFGLAAVMLVPTFLSLSGTLRDNEVGVHKAGASISFFDILYRLFSGTFDQSQIYDGAPNITCGVLALFLCIGFFFVKTVPVKKRIHLGALILILLISFRFDKINLIWHAFSEPSGYLFRQSFLFVFLVCICGTYMLAYLPEYIHSAGHEYIPAAASVIISIALLAISFGLKGIPFGDVRYTKNLTLILIFGILLTGYSCCGKFSHLVFMVIFSFALYDICAGGTESLRSLYLDNIHASEFKNAYASISDKLEKLHSSDIGFYRIENIDKIVENDSTLFAYNGVEHYSSSIKADTLNFLEDLGYTNEEFFINYKADNTLTSDAILGIRYILANQSAESLHTEYPSTEIEGVYENPSALPMAIPVSSPVHSGRCSDDNPFKLQEDIFLYMTETDVSPFIPASVIQEKSNESDLIYTYTVTAQADGNMYFYLIEKENKSTDVKISTDQVVISDYGNNSCYSVLNLGYMEEGERFVLTAEYMQRVTAPLEAIFITEDSSVVAKSCQNVQSRSLEITKISSSKLLVKAYADEKTQGIFTTIPYSEGFKVKVNGKKTKPLKDFDEFMYIPLEGSGEQIIEISYVPPGLWMGAVISVLSLFCEILLIRKVPIRICGG